MSRRLISQAASYREGRPGLPWRSVVRGLLTVLACLPLGIPHASYGQDREIPGDVQDLIFLGPVEPLKLRIRVRTEGKGFRTLRQQRLDHMFTVVDRDQSGMIEEAERSHLPTPQQLASGQMVAQPVFEEFDTDSPDGKFSKSEFDRYVSRMMGVLFHVQEPAANREQEIDLFGMLDRDGDGRLVPADVGAASERLRRLDFDHDESYSTFEIGPFQDPFGAVPRRRRKINSSDTPFRVIPDEGSLEKLAEEIGLRYSMEEGEASSDAVSHAALARTHAFRQRVDRNGNGTLETAEVVAWIEQVTPHVEIVADLPHPLTHRPRIDINPLDEDAVNDVQKENPRQFRFNMGGLLFHARAMVRSGAISDNRDLFRIRFLMSDGDKNGYLDESEFFGLQVPGASFVMVDRNGDGMLYVEEMIEYVDQEALASRSRAVMSVERGGQALFGIFDLDRNGRLTPRELLDAPAILAGLDRNGDGFVDEGELVGEYKLRFELGKPAVFDEDAPAMASAMAGMSSRSTSQAEGPLWFRRMDRNQDGDITQREFLGTREAFEHLDRDGDGLVAAGEADLADAAQAANTD